MHLMYENNQIDGTKRMRGSLFVMFDALYHHKYWGIVSASITLSSVHCCASAYPRFGLLRQK